MTLRQLGFSNDVIWKDFWTERTRLSYIYTILILVVLTESPRTLVYAALENLWSNKALKSQQIRNIMIYRCIPGFPQKYCPK